MTVRTVTCMLFAAALALPAQAPAAARGKTEPATTVLRTLPVDTHYVEPPPSLDGFDCRPSMLGAARPAETCRMRFVGTATFTGTVTAHETYDMLTWFEPDGDMRYEGSATFDGTVTGCGTGTFVIDVYEGEIDNDSFDPGDKSTKGFNKWSLRRGSGTGELKGLVSGSGVNNWKEYMFNGHDGSETFGYGHTTGTVKCRVPPAGLRRSRSR